PRRSSPGNPRRGSPRWRRPATPSMSSWPWSNRVAMEPPRPPPSSDGSWKGCSGCRRTPSVRGRWRTDGRGVMAQIDLPSAAPARSLAAERLPIRHVDVPLVSAAVGLAVFGLFMIYSSTHRSLAAFDQDPQYFLKRQITFLVVAAIALVVAVAIDYRYVRIYAPFLYLMALFLLILVRTPLGHSALGAQRWF